MAGLSPRPFTVVGGFLGAGKTTLVNHVLSEAAGTRFAVLVNDFGAINVDAGLIARHNGRTMALTNGCICCSMSDGFVQTMLGLMSDPGAFDHVVVEASGVAEPDRIMDFARADPMLAPDAILVLADADSVEERLADPRVGEVVARQIAAADILVLNKTDMVDAPALDARHAALRALNAGAPILRCHEARLPLDVLLGTGLGAAPRPSPHRHAGASFHTLALTADTPIDRNAFERWAAALPPTVLRGKGVLSLAGEPQATLWQLVGRRSGVSRLDRAPPERSDLVLIAAEPLDDLERAGLFAPD